MVNVTADAPAAPVAPVFTLLQWICSVVATGAVTGTLSVPLSCPAPPRVAPAAMVSVMGISLFTALPLLTVMPVGAPVTVPTVGVTLVAVSYTHLDVYKRQLLSCSLLLLRQRSA